MHFTLIRTSSEMALFAKMQLHLIRAQNEAFFFFFMSTYLVFPILGLNMLIMFFFNKEDSLEREQGREAPTTTKIISHAGLLICFIINLILSTPRSYIYKMSADAAREAEERQKALDLYRKRMN